MKEQEYCSFCGKSQENVEKMIIGEGVNICSECVDLCYSLLHQSGNKADKPKDDHQEDRGPKNTDGINDLWEELYTE